MANPSYTGNSGQVGPSTASNPSVTITNTTGNLLIAIQVTSTGGGTVALPSGWTAFAGSPVVINAISFMEVAAYYRTANGSASYAFGNAPPLSSTVVKVVEIANANQTPEAVQHASGVSGTADAGSITPGNVGDLLVALFGLDESNLSGVITPHASFTTTLGTYAHCVNVGFKSPASTSAVGNNSASLDTSEDWGVFLISVAPAAAAATPKQGRPGIGGRVANPVLMRRRGLQRLR